MTDTEIELSKKLLHAQGIMLALIEDVKRQEQEIEHLKLRAAKLEATVEAMCIVNRE